MELTFSHLYMFEATSLTCLCQLEFWNQVNCWKSKMLYYQSTSFDFLSVLYCWLNHTLFLYLAEPSTILIFLNSILCSFSFSVSCCVWLFFVYCTVLLFSSSRKFFLKSEWEWFLLVALFLASFVEVPFHSIVSHFPFVCCKFNYTEVCVECTLFVPYGFWLYG